MNHLTDLEELVAKVKNQEIRPFISEAVMCYTAGAYRGAIVIASQALFYDLRSKVSALSTINTAARELDQEISRRFAAQEIYESYLADKLAAMNVITELEKSILEAIRTHRNKAAHPSGHHPSAEEARYVVYEIVNTFLQKPDLYTTQAADWILSGLKSDNYFPTHFIDDVVYVVGEGIKHLHPGVYKYLVKQVSDGMQTSAGKENSNQHRFLAGLASLSCGNDCLSEALLKCFIEKHADKTAFSTPIRTAISLNPRLILVVENTVLLRITNMLSAAINDPQVRQLRSALGNPITIISNVLKENGADYVKDNLSDQVGLLVHSETFDENVIRISSSIPKWRDRLFNVITSRLGSSDFNTANLASESIVGLDSCISEKFEAEECLLVVLSIIKSARFNAFSSIDIVNSRFSNIPTIRDKALLAINGMDDDKLSALLKCQGTSLLGIDRNELTSVYLKK